MQANLNSEMIRLMVFICKQYYLEQKAQRIEAKKQKKLEREEKFKKIDYRIDAIPVKSDNMFRDITLKQNAKSRDKNLEVLLNPELLKLDNVSFKKYDKRSFERGMKAEEQPFPVTPRIDPYIIEDPILSVKNYFWCSCGMSRNQPF